LEVAYVDPRNLAEVVRDQCDADQLVLCVDEELVEVLILKNRIEFLGTECAMVNRCSLVQSLESTLVDAP